MRDNRHTPIRIGVIGAGFISQVAHLHSYAKLADVEIVALCDPRMSLAKQVAGKFSIPDVRDSVDDLLDDGDIDAVVVCTHRRCQAPLVERALRSGRNVFSEKPMAYSVAQARKLLAARSLTQLYAVGMMKKFDPGIVLFRERLRQVISDQSLGGIVSVDFADFCPTYGVEVPQHVRTDERPSFRYEEWPSHPESLAGKYVRDFDYMLNVGSHDINLARWMLPDEISARALFVSRTGALHAVLSTAEYDIALRIGRSDIGIWDQSLTVYFQHGRMELRLASPLDRNGVASARLLHPGKEETITVEPDARRWAFEAQAEHFCAAIRGDVLLENSGEDSLRDIQLIEDLWARVV